jgi:two-component system, cell cycle response regulator DivK
MAGAVQIRGGGSSAFAESQQKVLMGQEKIKNRHGQARTTGRIPEIALRHPGSRQEAGDTPFVRNQPGQGLQAQYFRPLRAHGMRHRQDHVKTFSLILRIQGCQHPQGFAGYPGPENEAMDAKIKTVLIVEDNELNMKLFHDLLDAHGYNILQTKDGMEALDIAREHHPDLILMDIQLPEVSGLEVTKWLKEDDSLKSIPVVAVTAFAMKGDEDVIRQGGCEAYISKPISVTGFLETVRRFIG